LSSGVLLFQPTGTGSIDTSASSTTAAGNAAVSGSANTDVTAVAEVSVSVV